MSDFAYGDNEIDGVGCPATQAGFNPTEMLERCDHRGYMLIGVQYDTVIRFELLEERREPPDLGHVDEETAKEAWLDAIEASTSALASEAGQEVAKELGWLSEEGSE